VDGCNESVAMEEKNREKKAKERRTTDLHPSLSAGIYPHVAYCSAFNSVGERGTENYFTRKTTLQNASRIVRRIHQQRGTWVVRGERKKNGICV